MKLPILVLLLSLAAAVAACAGPAPGSEAARGVVRGAIVNGGLEPGWPGVGALVWVQPGLGYQGAFCTGTLIAPQWVLTAAHCLDEDPGGFAVSPPVTRFYVGGDARPGSGPGGWPAAGELYEADAFVPHPDYDPKYHVNDVGLVHLAQPVAGAETYPVNAAVLTAAGEAVLYVGFGATEGVGKTGGGEKRSTSVPITWIYQDVYTSDFTGTGTCFGDSGGPGFLTLGGVPTLVGVTSALLDCDPAADPTCPADPCERTATTTRADVHAAWIAATLGAPLPSCQEDPAICFCEAACQPGGACDNAACQVLACGDLYDCLAGCPEADSVCLAACQAAATPAGAEQVDALLACLSDGCAGLAGAAFQDCASAACGDEIATCFPIGVGPASCEDVYDCLGGCDADDSACAFACYEDGTEAAQAAFDALAACLDASCAGLTGPAFNACVDASCAPEVDACFPPVYGPASCEEVQDCFAACPDGDDACPGACYDTGTPQAQAELDAMVACFAAACGDIADADAWLACVNAACPAQIKACFPPADCPIQGGGCPAGTACFPTLDGDTDCYPTDGKAEGAPCTASADTLTCADGLACLGGACAPLCAIDAHCGPGNVCNVPVWSNVDDVGTCACLDADQDGACADADCDDGTPAAAPGLPETCGDGLDNDCDGATDETCADPDPEPDAGTADADAGPSDADAATPDTDAGPPEPDASTGDADGGAADTGAPDPDTGAPDPDTGAPDPDSGTPADTAAGDAAADTASPADTAADAAPPDTVPPDTAPPTPDAGPDTAPPSGGTGSGGGSGCGATPRAPAGDLWLPGWLLLLGMLRLRDRRGSRSQTPHSSTHRRGGRHHSATCRPPCSASHARRCS